MYLDLFGVARLQAFIPDMAHLPATSCRNVINIDHTASAVFDAFWIVLSFR